MGKDLKSFLKGKGKNVDGFIEREIPKDRQQEAHRLRQQAEAFEGKSENELMNQLFANVDKAKKEGTFSEESLRQFAANAAPMMTPEQKKKLDELMKKIMK